MSYEKSEGKLRVLSLDLSQSQFFKKCVCNIGIFKFQKADGKTVCTRNFKFQKADGKTVFLNFKKLTVKRYARKKIFLKK